MGRDSRPAAVLIGGNSAAVSVARSLGRAGVRVVALNLPNHPIGHSRHCELAAPPVDRGVERAWAEFLLGPQSDSLRGAVLLSCCDGGLEILLEHRAALSERFVLEERDPAVQALLLSKLTTYRQAEAAGVPTPRFWVLDSLDRLEALRDEMVYPVLVKPVFSHKFRAHFDTKFVRATDFDSLREGYRVLAEKGIEALLLEEIPGPDDRLCSYYTYIDRDGNPLFDFTKRIIRRNPPNMGDGCYHVTDRNPEVRDLGLRFFRHAGLRGLGNVEFKRDVRDGKLKVLDCNARFTEGNALVARSGYDLARLVYGILTGEPHRFPAEYTSGLHLWDPLGDFRSYRALSRRGELTFAGWLRSIARRQVFKYFDWRDPLPTLIPLLRSVKRRALPGRPASRGGVPPAPLNGKAPGT